MAVTKSNLTRFSNFFLNFGEDRSSSFGGEDSNRNCVVLSRRGSAYFVEYLQMYRTEFRNLFTI